MGGAVGYGWEEEGEQQGKKERETQRRDAKEGEREYGAAGARVSTVRGRERWLDTAQTVQGVAGGNFCIGVESWETIDTDVVSARQRDCSWRDRRGQQGGLSGKVTVHVRSTRTVRLCTCIDDGRRAHVF